MQEEEEEDTWVDIDFDHCQECGWEGTLDDCETDTTVRNYVKGGQVEILVYHCPKCGAVVNTIELESDDRPDEYDPDRDDWDSGDYGDYGGE